MNTQQSFDAGRSFDAAQYQQNASFVPALGDVILGWLAPQPGEHILDLGAGDGVLTEKLVAAGAHVVAGDASPSMVAAAKARGLDGRLIDGEALDFDQAFDAVFSSAALHWMPDAARVSAGVFRALRPGGRFVAEAGGFGCVAAVRVALADAMERAGVDATGAHPWYFPTAEHHRSCSSARASWWTRSWWWRAPRWCQLASARGSRPSRRRSWRASPRSSARRCCSGPPGASKPRCATSRGATWRTTRACASSRGGQRRHEREAGGGAGLAGSSRRPRDPADAARGIDNDGADVLTPAWSAASLRLVERVQRTKQSPAHDPQTRARSA
jgi:SAM-dependent methyltransferase